MKTILIYLFTFFVISFVSFSQILEVKTVTEALNYAGNRNAVKKLIITDSIKGTDYSEGSEWREFRTLDTTFPNIEAVEILTDQDIPNYHSVNINDSMYLRGLFCLYYTDGTYNKGIFYTSNWLKYFSAPNTKRIGEVAFYRCKKLESVNFPNVEIIELGTFGGCINLLSIDFPKVKIIAGNGNFFGCSSLETINFPVIESIGWMAFRNCLNLKFVNLGTNFMNTVTVEFASAVFGDSLDVFAIIYNDNKVVTDNIELTLGENVLPVPDTTFNTWQKNNNYENNYENNYDYVWKSINTYSGIEEQINEKNIYNLGDNKYKLEDIEKAELYDLVGRKIMNINNQALLDLNHLTSGFYFLKYFDSNKILRIEKIIINRNF